MCGIVGITSSKEVTPRIVSSLKKLEYRGYDSAGIATLSNGSINEVKCEGRVDTLEKNIVQTKISGSIGIGHVRWATHGKPSSINAHPHSSEDVSVVHNGIIENYAEIKKDLLKEGFEFKSDTDTEVVAVELSRKWSGELLKTVVDVASSLEGTYALLVTTTKEEGTIVAGRLMSPLVLGVGDDEVFLASDSAAILELEQ